MKTQVGDFKDQHQDFIKFKLGTGIFFGSRCLRGCYKAPVPVANAHIFSQFGPKNSQAEGNFNVNQ